MEGYREAVDFLFKNRQGDYKSNHGLHLDGSRFERVNMPGFVFPEFSSAERARFNGSNLQGAQMYYGKYSYIELNGANLKDALLRRGCFNEAQFMNSSLINANIEGASFMWANLWSVNLSGSTCTNVNFYSAQLRKTIFDRAKLNGINFNNADLTEVDIYSLNLEGNCGFWITGYDLKYCRKVRDIDRKMR